MDELIAGYRRFRERGWPERRDVFLALAERGQSPRTLVIACSDSRVDPTLIFDVGPGELFVIRNVANLVPPYGPDAEPHATSAAIEFAVRSLKVSDIVVMGHAMCGGIHALLTGVPETVGDFVGPWLRIAERARDRALVCEPAERQAACEREGVKLSLDNLMTFPWIAERVAAGNLALRGTIFDIRSGVLSVLGADGTFAAA